MKLFVEIDCDNAAFDGGELHYEIGRLLRNAAKGIESGFGNVLLADINGNDVGRAFLTDDNLSIK